MFARVTIRVSDLEASVRFYDMAFPGAPARAERDPGGNVAEVA